MKKAFSELYYKKRAILPWLLLPLATVFYAIATIRRIAYQKHYLKTFKSSVPVVIVGNITLGGTGKTPLVIALVNYLQQKGFKPGVISRGYGANTKQFPAVVDITKSSLLFGDEPFLIHQKTNVPVVIDPKRSRAAEYIVKQFDCDILISDDGLQHYALQRDIEIAVLDGQRGLGNGFLFPAGPLRESKKRLATVDYVICNHNKCYKDSFLMTLQPQTFINLLNNEAVSCDFFKDKKNIIAVAGIGHPERFFDTLKNMQIEFQKHPMPDHYQFSAKDFSKYSDCIFLMTEKDVVKCKNFAAKNMFYLPVKAELEQNFFQDFSRLLSKILESRPDSD